MHRTTIAAVALAALALTNCAPAPAPESAQARPAVPEVFYREALARGQPVFAIDAEHSLVLVRVYRAGPLARFGHDHVVSSRAVRGYALLPTDLTTARADLYLAVESLAVDDPALRAEEGFPAGLTATDIEAARRHMLDSVLEGQRYPYVVIHAGCAGAACRELEAQVTAHGVTRTLRIPAVIRPGKGHWTVSGGFHLRLTDFGMVPYSALGGALQVADGVDLSFRIEAQPIAVVR